MIATGRVAVRSSSSLAAAPVGSVLGPDDDPAAPKLVDQSARGCAVERPLDDLSRSGAPRVTASMALRRCRAPSALSPWLIDFFSAARSEPKSASIH